MKQRVLTLTCILSVVVLLLGACERSATPYEAAVKQIVATVRADNVGTSDSARTVVSETANLAIDAMNTNFPEAKTRTSGKLLTTMRYEVDKYGTPWVVCKYVLQLAEEKLSGGD